MGIISGVSHLFFYVVITSWDVLLTLANLMRRKRPIGHVTPKGHPGYEGDWPEYKPPKETDSRCSCPALNAMANHGIISHSGRGISFVKLNHHIRATYNFSPTFCSYLLYFASRILKRSYSEDTFDLEELDQHNAIEHDASLLRLDSAFEPDQSTKYIPLIEELLAGATGKDRKGNHVITTKDLSRMLGKRRAEARLVNKEFSLSFLQKIFSSTKASTLVTIFGGRVDHLHSFLLEERLPEGWESRIRDPYGMTLTTFNKTILAVEFGVCERDWAEAP
ncbi:Chloroperoxidase [Suillus clintonianus]|uniref:Chloroperoxidase n=1 Tax=Suillus clintonianus TaxID=1904413 RepID=UPI001B874B0C|nr:Chloroperoxidase [Suillus clintonianus]KAG2140652.1 Chloroperoxidase [Suillus clintonianus]